MKTTGLSWHCGLALIGLGGLVAGLPSAGAGGNAERVRVIRVPGVSQVIQARRDANGSIHLLYDADGGPYYVRSTDGGATFGPPMAVVDAAARKPGLTFHAWDLAVGGDGRVHVALGNNAWKLKLPQAEWSLHYASLAPGAKTFSPVRNLNRQPSEGFSLAADDRGWVTACFLSEKLFAMVSRDHGETFTAGAELNPAWNPCNCCTTSSAYGRDGRLAVLYREETNNERNLHVILWNQRDRTPPERHRVSGVDWNVDACPMTYFTLAPTDTGYVAAWPTRGRVYFARLDSGGAVLPPGEIRTPGLIGMRSGTLALGAADGTTLVAWKHQGVLGWQTYDRQGRPQGDPGAAESPGSGAAGVVDRDGGFLLFP